MKANDYFKADLITTNFEYNSILAKNVKFIYTKFQRNLNKYFTSYCN